MRPWRLHPARDLGMPMRERWRSLRRESGLLETMAHVAWWSLTRIYLAIGHRLEVVGREHIPSNPPFVLAANHASHLDALVLMSAMPGRMCGRIFPIAAGDSFFETPASAAFAASIFNALPMWRNRSRPHELQELRRRLLADPCAYVIFPEGTRTRNGAMMPFRAGLGKLVAGTSIPVIPCCIDGTFKALPPNRHLPRLHKIALHIGRPMVFLSVPDERKGWEEIVKSVEAAVNALRLVR